MKEFSLHVKVVIKTEDELTPQEMRLLDEARQATYRSYAPYSHFSVGAAVELADGTIVSGCNQENAAYPSGLCAERTAVFYANSQHPDKPIEVSPNWLHNSEAVITGAVSPSVRSFRQSVDALSKGIIDPDKLVSGVFDIDDCQKAFEAAIRPDTFRCIIKM